MGESKEGQGGSELGGLFIDRARKVVQDRLNHLSGENLRKARSFLDVRAPARTALLIMTLVSAGCSNVNTPPSVNNQPSSISRELKTHPAVIADREKFSTPRIKATATPEPTRVPTKTPENVPENYTEQVDELIFTMDKEGIPLSYKDNNGKITKIDQVKLAEIRKKAISGSEPEIFTEISIPVESGSNTDIDPKEHPIAKELPKDVLTTEQLKQRGIEIIQADNTQLYIRSSAFEKGGPLQDYTGTKNASSLAEDGKNHLKIYLLNAPIVSRLYMNDPKYKDLKEQLRTLGPQQIDPQVYRKKNLDELEKELIKLRKEKTVENEEELDNIIVSYKERVFAYEHATDDELLREAIQVSSDVAGLFTNDTVVIAVGEGTPRNVKIAIYTEANGEISFAKVTGLSNKGLQPSADQGYPDPKTFKRNSGASSAIPGSYPYGAQKIGLVLRHELGHDELMSGPLRRHNSSDFTKPDGTFDSDAYTKATLGDYSEYDTDELAMRYIAEAWNKWKNSGYRDNSGYSFVFSLPGGGYILTEKDKPVTQIM